MGGWSNRIGKYQVSQMDYYYENIKENNMPLNYFQTQTVQVKLENLETGKEKMIDVPLIELHDLMKNNDDDLYSINDNKSLMNWLWEKLKKSKTEIICKFKLNIHANNENCPTYYLNSKPMDDNIIITTNPMKFKIINIEELYWIGKHGFCYA